MNDDVVADKPTTLQKARKGIKQAVFEELVAQVQRPAKKPSPGLLEANTWADRLWPEHQSHIG